MSLSFSLMEKHTHLVKCLCERVVWVAKPRVPESTNIELSASLECNNITKPIFLFLLVLFSFSFIGAWRKKKKMNKNFSSLKTKTLVLYKNQNWIKQYILSKHKNLIKKTYPLFICKAQKRVIKSKETLKRSLWNIILA